MWRHPAQLVEFPLRLSEVIKIHFFLNFTSKVLDRVCTLAVIIGGSCLFTCLHPLFRIFFLYPLARRGGFKAESLLSHITRKASSPLPSLLFPPSLLLLPRSSLPLPSLRSRPLKSSYGVWGIERCKLPQRGLGQSPTRNRIWCILALKSDIWWQQF